MLKTSNVKLNPCVQGEDGPRIKTDENESSWESPLKRIFDMRKYKAERAFLGSLRDILDS